MKKITAILFLSVFLFTTTELSQLFKIPQLITHYREHRAENKDLSLWQFLCIHYAHGNVKDADYDKDMKLPFKTSDFGEHMTFSVFEPFSPCNYSIVPVFYPLQKQAIAHQHGLPSSFISNIWQPPRKG